MESEASQKIARGDEEKDTHDAKTDAPRVEVSAATVTRMMGIATITDIKLLDSKLDLMSAKVAAVMTKLDKVVSSLNGMPTATDVDRLEIQLGSVKAMLKEVVESLNSAPPSTGAESQEQSRKLREGIRTNNDE